MADPKDPKILRDAEGFPFPDEGPSTAEADASSLLSSASGVPTVPSELGAYPEEGASEVTDPFPVDCPKGFVWDVEEQICVPNTNLDNYDNPEFNFDDCEPSDANLEAPPVCEVCIKDPLAFVPEWTRLADEEVFFDGKKCLYSAVVDATKYTYQGDFAGEDRILEVGLKLIFEFLQKQEVIKGAEYQPEYVLGRSIRKTGKYIREDRDIYMIDELLKLDDVVKLEKKVSIRPNIPTKYLVSVPVEYVINLPDVVVADIPSDIPVDDPLKVQFMGKDIKEKFHVMANSLNGAMMVYHRQYQIWLRQGGGVFKKTKYNSETERFEVTRKNFKLDLKDHAEKMRDFLDELSELLSTQGLVIPGFGFELRTQGPNVDRVIINIENIDKAPGGKLRIKNVKANKKGCELVVFSENRPATKHYFKKFERKFRNSTLLAYIGQVPNMCLDSQAREPSEWFDWVVNHTYPPIEIQLGLNATDPASEASLASCAVGGLVIDPIEDILNSLGEELGQVLQMKFDETVCLTPEELQEQLEESRQATLAAKAKVQELRNQLKDHQQALRETEEEAKAYLDDPSNEPFPFADFNQQLIDDEKKKIEAIKKEIKENKIFLSKELTEKMRGVNLKTEMQKYVATNPLFERLPKLLDSFAKKGKGSKKKLWKDVVKKMGPCGMLALLSEAMECLMKSMEYDDDLKKKLIESAFKAMDNANLEKIFIGLPPKKQQEILEKVGEEFQDVDPPWKDPYREGTYSGHGWSKEDLRDDVLQAQDGYTQEELNKLKQEDKKAYNKAIKETAGGNLKNQRKNRRDAAKDEMFDPATGRILPGGGVQHHPKQGSLSMAVSDAQGVIFDAYIEAMLELVGVDDLMDQLNKLPGAKLIAELIKDIPCKRPPPWQIDPPLGEFFRFNKLDPCDLRNTTGVWQFPPKVTPKKGVNLQYMPGYIYYLLKEVAEHMAFVAKILILKAILDIITRLICLALEALGAAITRVFTGDSNMMNMLKNELCGAGAKDEAIEESILELLDTLTGPEGSCLETMDPSDIGDFIDTISATLLQTEMLDLLQGTASPDVLEMVTQLAMMSGSPCIAELFSDPNNVADLFRSLGNIIDLSELENLVSQLEGDPAYISPNICADPLALENVNKIRCYLLTQKGLTEEECQEEIDKLKNQALDDLGDLADMMHGTFAEPPPLDSTGPNLCGPEDGVFPYNSPVALDAQQTLTNAMFEDLAIAHSRDLLGAGGFLTMVLSDTNGKGLKAHNFWVRYFGSSEARYLGIIDWYTDDAIAQLDERFPIGQGGKELDGPEGKGGNIINNAEVLKTNVTTGGFPPTVGSWLKVDLEQLGKGKKKLFKTTTIPPGYNSIAEANAAQAAFDRRKARRAAIRSDYIEAWILAYDIEDKTGKVGGRHRLAADLREGINDPRPLFLPNDPSMTEFGYGDITKNSPRDLAREVLMGKQVWGGVGHKFHPKGTRKYDLGKNPSMKWSDRAKKRAVRTLLDEFKADVRREIERAEAQGYTHTSGGMTHSEFFESAVKNEEYNLMHGFSYFIDEYPREMWNPGEWVDPQPVGDTTYHGDTAVSAPSKGGGYITELDLSSADLPLSFVDYLDEYGVRVQYDPNPVDADNILMSYPDSSRGNNPRDAQGDLFEPDGDDSYILSIYEKWSPKAPYIGDQPYEQIAPPPTTLAGDAEYARTHKLKGTTLIEPEVTEFIDETLDINSEMEKVMFGRSGFDIADKNIGLSKQGIAFTNIIKNAILERAIGPNRGYTAEQLQFAFQVRQNLNLIELNKRQRSKVFDDISDYYVKQIAKRISENKRAFDFGWDASDKPKVKILDPLKYGGTETEPPFYLQPPKRGGWLGLVDDIIPEWDGCEPRRKDLIDFDSLKELVDQRNQSLPEDPRLESDPLCVNEAPYDRIIDKYSFASIEGIIAATIRIYVAEMILQAMPVFSLFHARFPENFDDVMLGYVVDKMEAGLIDEGTKFNLFKGQVEDKTYWYQFVEMAVKSYISRLPEEYNPAGNGEIEDPTPLEIEAYNNIAAAVETFYHIEKYEYDPDGRGLAALTNNAINGQSLLKNIMEKRPASVRAAKNAPVVDFTKAAARSAKELAFNDIMEETIDDAKILLRRLVREETQRLADQFNSSIKPTIFSMDSLLLGNLSFINGSIKDADGNFRDPLNVSATDTGDPEYPYDTAGLINAARDEFIAEMLDIYEDGQVTVEEALEQVDAADATVEEIERIKKGWYGRNFVLQKYIRITDKGEAPTTGWNPQTRARHLYDIVNIDAWDAYVKKQRDAGRGGKISEWFGPGITIETDTDPESETFGEEIEVGESGWRFGVRICYAAQDDTERELLRKILKDVDVTQSMNQKAFAAHKTGAILIPVAHGELEIPDQQFTNFDPASYDIDCLIAELIKDPAYKTLFNYCFPLKTFLSTLTIYCIKAFIPSIGNSGPPAGGGDRWVVAGGRKMSGFRMWDGKKEPFRRSTKKARQQFEVLYNSTTKDNEYNDREDNGAKQKFFDKFRPKWNYDLGLRWWMMPRQRPRPYDKHGNECE